MKSVIVECSHRIRSESRMLIEPLVVDRVPSEVRKMRDMRSICIVRRRDGMNDCI